MARVTVEISETQLENESGREVDGVRAQCSQCGHTTESFGTGEGSRKRGLVLVRDQCPERKNAF